jgi:hypothetical protein
VSTDYDAEGDFRYPETPTTTTMSTSETAVNVTASAIFRMYRAARTFFVMAASPSAVHAASVNPIEALRAE